MGVSVGSKPQKEQETLSFYFKCSWFFCSALLLAIVSRCLLHMVPYMPTCTPPSDKKVIPKQKPGRVEHLSGRTCHWPCSFLGSWLSSAPITGSNSPDEIRQQNAFHLSMVLSLLPSVWLRLTVFLWRFQVTCLWVFLQISAPVQSQTPVGSFWCPRLPPCLVGQAGCRCCTQLFQPSNSVPASICNFSSLWREYLYFRVIVPFDSYWVYICRFSHCTFPALSMYRSGVR